MRPGPATRAAFVRGFLLGGITASARQRPKDAAFAKARCRSVALRSRTCNRRGWPAACPAPKSRRGRRPQRPGNQSALARVVWSPPAIHPRESLAAAGSAAIIRKPRNSHVSLHPLSARSPFVAIQKECAVVQKLWRMSFPCGRLRKTKN